MSLDFGGRLLIGGIVSFFVVWILSAYDRRLANLYVLAFILMLIIVYRNQIIPSINIILGTIKGSLS